MTRARLELVPTGKGALDPPSVRESVSRAGVVRGKVASLPFLAGDATAGSETELQVVVIGTRETVDLPLTIERSSYFANAVRRTAAGESPAEALCELERFLLDNPSEVWENSWVRFPLRLLSPAAREVLEVDLAADREDPGGPRRGDHERFFLVDGNEGLIRVPISYLLKLALAEVAADEAPAAAEVQARRLLACFSNDNISPETLSFRLVDLAPASGGGRAVAAETARRFLVTQLLVLYANERFQLRRRGQEVAVFYAPNPPQRQRRLSRIISDTFYRELFISPCLSGWRRGEDKLEYMRLCHQVLSRSQLQAVVKLRDAGINLHNLVVLPQMTNLSLANNGTHVSLGSRRLSSLRADEGSGFSAAHEKVLADLVIKIAEHFLPLFVGTFSAAPYRLDFADFHPEQLLGFLPHQLSDTHLRMLWRRWRNKASNRRFGQPWTPFGPPWLDRSLAAVLRLRGDWVPDLRLLDYPVAVLSTETSPALDGRLGNSESLKRDLDALGVIDARMALYLPWRSRESLVHGFTGVEARNYSLFPGFHRDLAPAVDLQQLVVAFAWQLIGDGRITHAHIPDRPQVESERRQLFFAAAMGVERVYVKTDTANQLLREVLGLARGVRPSKRYPGYLKLDLAAYRLALVGMLERQAAPLVEALGSGPMLADLRDRLAGSGRRGRPASPAASDRLLDAILAQAGESDPLRLDATSFNGAAEELYRGPLRRQHLDEALADLETELVALEAQGGPRCAAVRAGFGELLAGASAAGLVASLRPALLAERLRPREARRLLQLLLLLEAEHVSGARADSDLDALDLEGPWQPTPTWTAAPAMS